MSIILTMILNESKCMKLDQEIVCLTFGPNVVHFPARNTN